MIYLKNIKQLLVNKFILSILYIYTFQYIYINYLAVAWDYFGYSVKETSFLQYLSTYFFALIPIFFYKGLSKVSSYFAVLIYLLGYVPIMITILLNRVFLSYNYIVLYQFVLMISMCLFFLADKVKLPNITKPKKLPTAILHVITISMVLYLFIVYRGNIRMVGFEDVYGLRFENAERQTVLSGYFEMWLSYCIFPAYFIWGLTSKKVKFILLGILGNVFIYMITGAKYSMVLPIIIWGMYLLLRSSPKYNFYHLLTVSLIILSGIAYLSSEKLFVFAALFLMRTLSTPGLLFSQYLIFFSNHPHTYYTHIGVINKITHGYPYSEGLGQTIGWHFLEKETNSNANFWATDGIAGAGIWGILIISALIFLFFLFLNQINKGTLTNAKILIFTGPIISLLNLSFFTAFISGGLLIAILLISFFKFE